MYVRVQTLDKQSLRYRRPESFVIRPHGRSSVRQSVRNSIASTAGGPGQMSSVEAAIRQARRELNLLSEEKKDDAFLSGRADNDEDDLMDDAEEPKMNFLGQWRAQRAIYQDDYRRSVEVANQAVWYLGVFYITHVWSTTTRIIQQVRHGKTFFPVILLHSWFDPLQGFLNFVVYQRPRYLKIRKAHPRLGRLGAAWRALRFAYLPPLDVSSSTPLRSSSRWTDRETFSTVPARTQVVADPDPDHGVDKFERHEGDQATKESSALDNSEGSSSASPQAMETHVGPGDNNKNNANEEAQITRPDDSSVVLA